MFKNIGDFDMPAKRITIDLSPSAAAEVDRLCDVTGRNVSEVFRKAMSLMRIAVNAGSDGLELHLVDPAGKRETSVIDLSTK